MHNGYDELTIRESGLAENINLGFSPFVEVCYLKNELDSLQKKYREQTVLLYHARVRFSCDDWLDVLRAYEANPTMESLYEGVGI